MHQNILFSSVFIAGMLSFFAPCTYSLLPIYIGLMTGKRSAKKIINIGPVQINLVAITHSLAFVAGLSLAFVLLGFGAGALGGVINSRSITFIGGLLIVVFGLHQMGVIKIKRLDNITGINVKNSYSGLLKVFVTGIAFSLGWSPCVGPVLGAVMITAASSGQAAYGALLMLVYSIGLAVPFILMALASDVLMTKFKYFEKYLDTLTKVGGVLLVIMGIILMSDQMTAVSAFFEKLG